MLRERQRRIGFEEVSWRKGKRWEEREVLLVEVEGGWDEGGSVVVAVESAGEVVVGEVVLVVCMVRRRCSWCASGGWLGFGAVGAMAEV